MARRTYTAILIVGLLSATGAVASGQEVSAPARISGAVRDSTGAVLPGVTVTLLGSGGETRQVVTTGEGRYIFDDVEAGRLYVIRSELIAFVPDEERDIVVAPGESRTIDIEMEVGCVDEQGIRLPDLDLLVAADAIAHVRFADDAGIDIGDNCGPSRSAIVLNTVSFSGATPRAGATVLVKAASRFEPGKEYVLFLNVVHTRKGTRFWGMWDRSVVSGRLRGASAADLRIRGTEPVDQALRKLGELRQLYHRHRDYKGLSLPRAGLETLQYETGWLIIGAADLKADEWLNKASFEYLNDIAAERELPRRNDRVRFKDDESIFILDFGARGEELRKRSPGTRSNGWSIVNDTDTIARAGAAYRIVDVQFQRTERDRLVWVRLVAD